MTIQTHLDAILKELRHTLEAIDPTEVTALIEAIGRAPRIFVAGAGRSGLVMRGFAMRLMHLGYNVHAVGETTTPAIAAGDLLLIGSGSGSTAGPLQSAQTASSIGATIALVTIHRESPIARLADHVLSIQAPTPKLEQATGFRSVQPMGSLFEQSLGLLLDALIMQSMAKTGQDQSTMFGRHANLE